MEEPIKEIGIDEEGRLYIKPSISSFPMIYREAMEVHWNEKKEYLFGAKPRKWGYVEWYQQILKAAQEQGCVLVISSRTLWVNVPSKTQKQIQSA